MVTNKFFIQSREKLFCFEHSNAFSGLLNEIFVCARESDLLSHTPNEVSEKLKDIREIIKV